jgi:hypothetical protein
VSVWRAVVLQSSVVTPCCEVRPEPTIAGIGASARPTPFVAFKVATDVAEKRLHREVTIVHRKRLIDAACANLGLDVSTIATSTTPSGALAGVRLQPRQAPCS